MDPTERRPQAILTDSVSPDSQALDGVGAQDSTTGYACARLSGKGRRRSPYSSPRSRSLPYCEGETTSRARSHREGEASSDTCRTPELPVRDTYIAGYVCAASAGARD